jgi:hypothetical protein
VEADLRLRHHAGFLHLGLELGVGQEGPQRIEALGLVVDGDEVGLVDRPVRGVADDPTGLLQRAGRRNASLPAYAEIGPWLVARVRTVERGAEQPVVPVSRA